MAMSDVIQVKSIHDTQEIAALSDTLTSNAEGKRRPGKAMAVRLFANGITTVVWVGVVLIGAAFGVLAYTWGKVAGTVNVGLQLPYLVSGGISALAMIVVGATLINAAVKRQDATARERQITELKNVLEDIRTSVSPD